MPVPGTDKARSLETAISAIRGVRRARVEATDDGIEAIRVLVIPERKTSDITSTIQRLAADRSLPVDPSLIQVVRVDTNGASGRRRLTSVTTERTLDRFRSKVMLELGGDILVGESDVPVGVDFERRSMATAVLGGVKELLEFHVELETVRVIEEGDHRIALVTLTRGSEILVGAAAVTTNENDAVVRATLDALNRFTVKDAD
jgi:hypothetical protein